MCLTTRTTHPLHHLPLPLLPIRLQPPAATTRSGLLLLPNSPPTTRGGFHLCSFLRSSTSLIRSAPPSSAPLLHLLPPPLLHVLRSSTSSHSSTSAPHSNQISKTPTEIHSTKSFEEFLQTPLLPKKMATSLNTCTTFFFSTPTKPNNHNSLSFKPNTFTPPNPTTSRLSRSCVLAAQPRRSSVYHVYNSGKFIARSSGQSEPESTSEAQSDAPFEDTIDIQLPRRSLLVQFTCNSCAERTERYINRLAYERGLVYVQCAGCLKYHKLVDNLGLVIEHNLLEEADTTPS